MAQNLNEYLIISSGVNESLSNVSSCAIETAQAIAQHNEYLMQVFVVGMVVGAIAVSLGIALGAWYRGRQN
jgi:hypothetical protein